MGAGDDHPALHQKSAIRCQGTAGSNSFSCPRHGAQFNISCAVKKGPENRSLSHFITTMNGTTLRVFS
ncbi:MAG: Rieske 2Fe-2S domain-containing protein [Bacteroidota bacterium]